MAFRRRPHLPRVRDPGSQSPPERSTRSRRATAAPRFTSPSTSSAQARATKSSSATTRSRRPATPSSGRERHRSSPTSVPTSGPSTPQAVEAAITPRTVGILAVDVFGQPADYDELRAIADRHGLWIIEDAACSAGASYKGRPAGSLADVATFSFHGRKGITAGEGGALTTDDGALADHARKLHTYGIAPALSREGSTDLPVPSFDEAGYNYRLSDVAAGIMLAQLDRLPGLVARRGEIAGLYQERLLDVDGVTAPVALD